MISFLLRKEWKLTRTEQHPAYTLSLGVTSADIYSTRIAEKKSETRRFLVTNDKSINLVASANKAILAKGFEREIVYVIS